MPLATQSGALLVKDGKLQTDCRCCREGCCCVNGAGTKRTEQQCAAVGGTWKSYLCNSPAPSSILLTLSLNNYSAYLERSPTSTAPGVWDFDFMCIKNTYALQKLSSGPYNWGVLATEATVSLLVSTTGGFGPGGSSTTCGCQTPLFLGGSIDAREETISRRSGSTAAMNCNAGPILAGNAWGLSFVADGQSYGEVKEPVPVPGFCSGAYTTGGAVWGPGGVQCGTYTLGNPLP